MMIAPDVKLNRVLIIDDELGPRESLRILLKKKYEVFCADSVDRGLELLQEKQPDVVVSDIRMPGVNGIEGLKLIREIDAEVPVIMLTGYGALETAQEAIRLGANDYMKKPFDANDMLAIIQRNVERGECMRRREQSRRTIEDLNKQLLDEIAHKNRLAAMGQASAELVHDLRNPMMIILGYVQLLGQELNDTRAGAPGAPHETVEYMDVIEQNVRRCKELIESWLDLSRNHHVALKPLNISEILQETVTGMRPLAVDKQAAIEFQIMPEPLGIMGHSVQLKRALQNLVGNALDALHGSEGRIFIACSNENNQVQIVISDNGEGIEQQHLPHIFEPFYSKKTNGQGTGLGLFITQKIIEDHHGTITIDSARGRGTRVFIQFPALQQSCLLENAAP
jgi:signal transduction histidine kinase